jgi:hypothetical protein
MIISIANIHGHPAWGPKADELLPLHQTRCSLCCEKKPKIKALKLRSGHIKKKLKVVDKKYKFGWAPVAHSCNASYLEG